MKQIYILIILLFSLFLTSCQYNNSNENIARNNTNVITENNQDMQNTKDPPIKRTRISYNDYMKQNGTSPELINDNTENNEITENEAPVIQENENFLASYSTPLLSKDEGRTNNIEIVCERLNGFILKPNETFSYNEVTGPFGEDDGFEEATILLSDGTKSKGYGGGVCQLSSTLYNVVKNIDNIEITERHHHSAPVSYVPEGQDATVSLQSGLDFKFINNTSDAIRFKAVCDSENVSVYAFKEI